MRMSILSIGHPQGKMRMCTKHHNFHIYDKYDTMTNITYSNCENTFSSNWTPPEKNENVHTNMENVTSLYDKYDEYDNDKYYKHDKRLT